MSKQSQMPNDVDVEVGRRIGTLRRKIGMRQQDLAMHLDVSVQLIRKYENGRIRISSSRLAAIAVALDVPVAFLVDRDEAHFDTTASRELAELAAFLVTKEGNALNTAFQRIKSAAVRRSLLALIEVCSQPL